LRSFIVVFKLTAC